MSGETFFCIFHRERIWDWIVQPPGSWDCSTRIQIPTMQQSALPAFRYNCGTSPGRCRCGDRYSKRNVGRPRQTGPWPTVTGARFATRSSVGSSVALPIGHRPGLAGSRSHRGRTEGHRCLPSVQGARGPPGNRPGTATAAGPDDLSCLAERERRIHWAMYWVMARWLMTARAFAEPLPLAGSYAAVVRRCGSEFSTMTPPWLMRGSRSMDRHSMPNRGKDFRRSGQRRSFEPSVEWRNPGFTLITSERGHHLTFGEYQCSGLNIASEIPLSAPVAVQITTDESRCNRGPRERS